MRITQIGHRLMTSHISGPTHNFLEFSLSDEPVPGEPAMVLDEPCEGWPLDRVREAVLTGIEQAGGAKQVSGIRVVGTDTPIVDVYRHMARKLVEHIQEQQGAETPPLPKTSPSLPFLDLAEKVIVISSELDFIEEVVTVPSKEAALPASDNAASVKRKVRS